jgi:hypothetical protein
LSCRDLCAACETLAPLFEMSYKAYNASDMVPAKYKLTMDEIIEKTCDRVGYYKEPYVWLEEHCENIVGDFAGNPFV